MPYVVTQNCCNDAACVPVCPVGCIHPAPGEPGYATAEMLYIDPDTCIDCGACADVCPVEAISPDDSLEGADLRYIDINADFYACGAHRPTTLPLAVLPPKVTVGTDASVLRVAIIGSGPSACYAAEELLSRRGVRVEVTMIERLPFAGGLVRYGVAPDHSKTKGVDKTFARTIRRSGMTFFLDVEVGRDLSLDEVAAHHHAVIVATGATEDRRLNVEGEALAGVHGAREFVAWYNGHPDYSDVAFDLSDERAVVVGNGNVALDVARVLVADLDHLRRTDIADHALDVLSGSAVREVVVLGRRGVEAAAGTVPELLGLASLSGVDVLVDGDVAASADATYKTRVLAEYAAARPTAGNRRIILRFNSVPERILGESRVAGIRLSGPEAVTDLDCGLILRSIGYRGSPFPGLPFDEVRGTVANVDGRVVEPESGSAVVGRYVTGWIKRGPSGVIGTNRVCARQTVAALFDDFAAGSLSDPASGAERFAQLVTERRPSAMTADDWFTVDRHERTVGRAQGRPRVKLLNPRPALA
ncbi:FAD-dependent oxidoreductase [Gordonia sp. TBRC 11910]|uniref:ferredoxin--NADP(+) reductase n=1 Tax=Gordonia asplenii TaxID=2725283 RepID=A0A848KZV8_9ACTN|nr:FAD-dependent oxidoreductase [Gordonia asplenii]NMO03707.1 FAD-dependent oxidoreductase [Gordonia asplenii]